MGGDRHVCRQTHTDKHINTMTRAGLRAGPSEKNKMFPPRGLLESSDVDLRMTAGESLALVLEFSYDYDSDYEPEDLAGLIVTVKQLATDSTKSRSKKDRKEQRSTFRDVLRGVEEGEPPSQKVTVGMSLKKG